MNKTSFTVVERLVKERDGVAYDLSRYVEGVDYVRRKAFKGERVLFRKGFLEQESPSSVNHDVDDHTHDDINRSVMSDDAPDYVVERPVEHSGSGVYQAKIVKFCVNRRWVETDQGRVWVGMQHDKLKPGMVIVAQDGLFKRKCV